MSVQIAKAGINVLKAPETVGVKRVCSGINSGIIRDGFYDVSWKSADKGLLSTIKEGFDKLFLPSNILSSKFINEKEVQKIIDKNPNITKILNENGIKPVINAKNIKDIKPGHIDSTVNVCEILAKDMGLTSGEVKKLKLAAEFHDYGKILIPANILNKPGKLTPEDRKIVDLHSRLSYELLLNSGLGNGVLYPILNHHTPACMTPDLKTKILSAADVYSALIEKRPYKEPYSPEEAIKIMFEMTKTGKLDTDAVRHLERITGSLKNACIPAA